MSPLRRFASSPQRDRACGRAKPVPRRVLEQVDRCLCHFDRNGGLLP